MSKRDQIKKAMLRQRVSDIATGAAGYEFDAPDDFATAEILSKWIAALKVKFGNAGNDYLWQPRNLHYFNDVDSATDFLWNHKVRA